MCDSETTATLTAQSNTAIAAAIFLEPQVVADDPTCKAFHATQSERSREVTASLQILL